MEIRLASLTSGATAAPARRCCNPGGARDHAARAYDLKDREIAAEVDAIAISVRREGGLLIAEAERNDLQPGS